MLARPKVLLSAYACRPQGGSEPGAGWAWAKAAARDHDVWLLTRGKFAHEIAEELAIRPVPGLTVVPLELPKWILRLRRRPADVYWYYPLWQGLARRTARELHARAQLRRDPPSDLRGRLDVRRRGRGVVGQGDLGTGRRVDHGAAVDGALARAARVDGRAGYGVPSPASGVASRAGSWPRAPT